MTDKTAEQLRAREKLEARYFVLKGKDLPKDAAMLVDLYNIKNEHDFSRAARGASPFDCIVIEKDWPEYEVVLKMLSDRIGLELVEDLGTDNPVCFDCKPVHAPIRSQAKPSYSYGHCEQNRKEGGCQLNNVQCGYPDCDRRPIEGNTRADSGEAVAYCEPDNPFNDKAFAWPGSERDQLRHTTPLFTHSRATAVDGRYVTVKHPRFFNEEENNAWHRALPDLMAAFDAIAAIASRDG